MPVAKSQAEFDKYLKDEEQITAAEAKKFKKDKQGNLIVPDDYEPPSGFRGSIMKESGIQLSYPGYRIIKQFGQKKTIAR